MRRLLCGLVVVMLAPAVGTAAEPQAAAPGGKPGPAATPPPSARNPNHPLYEARLDPNSASYDPSYDPKKDPNHPLKDKTKDPGADTRVPDLPVDVKQLSGGWPWGELFYGKSYPATLNITNHCKTTETIAIFVNNLPYITLPATVTVKKQSTLALPITIQTPPPPNPLLTGAPDEPKMDPNAFTDVSGSVVLWHAWTPPRPECLPKRTEYTVTGHIHRPPVGPPPSDPDAKLPEKIAGPDACQVWWNTGMRPPQVKTDDECLDRLRQLAFEYRTRILQGHADREPAAWKWLPAPDAVGGMSIGQLFEMKARADAQINGKR